MLHKKDNDKTGQESHDAHHVKNGRVELSEKEYEELKKKAEEAGAHQDKWLRAHADFENMRKRMEKDKVEFAKYANEDMIVELLGIVDNFERGLKAAEQKKDFDLLHQGVDMILKQLHQLLEARGLRRIKSAGEKFDPYRHEALEVVPGEPDMEGQIADELQTGYELNGRVIRPAKVRVVKNESAEKEEESEDNVEN
jgi:molecular chaperone GrpE